MKIKYRIREDIQLFWHAEKKVGNGKWKSIFYTDKKIPSILYNEKEARKVIEIEKERDKFEGKIINL